LVLAIGFLEGLLLAISGWRLANSLTNKSGVILIFKGLGSNS